MREEISCLRDRHGACVSLLWPLQTLVIPLHFPLLPVNTQICVCVCWDSAVRFEVGCVCVGGGLQNLHVTWNNCHCSRLHAR